jgi:hypothetical protein
MTANQRRIICIPSLTQTIPTSSGCSEESRASLPLFFAHKVTPKQPSGKATFRAGNAQSIVGIPYHPDDFYIYRQESNAMDLADWIIAALAITVVALELAGVLA